MSLQSIPLGLGAALCRPVLDEQRAGDNQEIAPHTVVRANQLRIECKNISRLKIRLRTPPNNIHPMPERFCHLSVMAAAIWLHPMETVRKAARKETVSIISHTPKSVIKMPAKVSPEKRSRSIPFASVHPLRSSLGV